MEPHRPPVPSDAVGGGDDPRRPPPGLAPPLPSSSKSPVRGMPTGSISPIALGDADTDASADITALIEGGEHRRAALAELSALVDAREREAARTARNGEEAAARATEAEAAAAQARRELATLRESFDGLSEKFENQGEELAAAHRRLDAAGRAEAQFGSMKGELDKLKSEVLRLREDLEIETVACNSATDSCRKKEVECASLRKRVEDLEKEKQRAIADAVASAEKLRAITNSQSVSSGRARGGGGARGAKPTSHWGR